MSIPALCCSSCTRLLELLSNNKSTLPLFKGVATKTSCFWQLLETFFESCYNMLFLPAGASEAENLCYMERLGLWGPGSAFPSKKEFVGLLRQVRRHACLAVMLRNQITRSNLLWQDRTYCR